MKKFVFKLVSEIWTKKLKPKWVGQIILTIFFENFFFSKNILFWIKDDTYILKT
jgi:hypothetical protein